LKDDPLREFSEACRREMNGGEAAKTLR